MSKFTREDIMTLLTIVIGIALIILAVKFVIALLPFAIVFLVLMLVYDSLKKNGFFSKKKKNEIMDAEIIEEKKRN